jgi:hypothetical protein
VFHIPLSFRTKFCSISQLIMHYSVKGALAALATSHIVSAHTGITNLYVDGLDQGAGTCIRMDQVPEHFSYPVSSLTSNDMVCGKCFSSLLCCALLKLVRVRWHRQCIPRLFSEGRIYTNLPLDVRTSEPRCCHRSRS